MARILHGLCLVSVTVAAVVVAYYFGVTLPQSHREELTLMRASRRLELARQCASDGRRFSSEFIKAHPPMPGRWEREWDEPEFHHSAALNTCLVYVHSVEFDRPRLTITNSIHNSYVMDVFSNKALLQSFVERSPQDHAELPPMDLGNGENNLSSKEFLAKKDRLFRE
jgi:hypothetical protein